MKTFVMSLLIGVSATAAIVAENIEEDDLQRLGIVAERPALCADLTGDGEVNSEDLGIMREQFFKKCTAEIDHLDIVCDTFIWNMLDVEDVPDYVTLWPFTDEYIQPWISSGLYPQPRPDDWEELQGVGLKPCLIRAGEQAIPVLLHIQNGPEEPPHTKDEPAKDAKI